MLKIGIGPSSSHTLGPWRAAERWINHLEETNLLADVNKIKVELYGSLSLTGKGHATDIAVVLGLLGHDPETMDIQSIDEEIMNVQKTNTLLVNLKTPIDFNFEKDIVFRHEFLPYHPNGIKFKAYFKNGKTKTSTYYSIGGGFVVVKERKNAKKKLEKFLHFPFPIDKGNELLEYCRKEHLPISSIVLKNEYSLRTPEEIDNKLKAIWEVMLESMYIGCHTEGILPGGLQVKRRAFEIHQRLIGDIDYKGVHDWIPAIRNTEVKFRQILKWVSCFAISVNEVNASLGRVVTAPTNGSAGTVPAVLMYYLTIENHNAGFEEIKRFLLVAGEIGSLFKKGATISAALGGCQAEIGVSSAMAAGALAELLGATPDQVLMAAEIAMEHHLGMTCDPIAGLVQIPCIERNAMGAIKAINAAEIALESDASKAKVTLDGVIDSMWETALDMNSKYKETSEGGLAVKVSVTEC